MLILSLNMQCSKMIKEKCFQYMESAKDISYLAILLADMMLTFWRMLTGKFNQLTLLTFVTKAPIFLLISQKLSLMLFRKEEGYCSTIITLLSIYRTLMPILL